MADKVLTLTELLGKPEFQPTRRMDAIAENAIMTHVRERRSLNHFPITTDDLTTLLEVRVEELDLYANLTDYGPGVEGLTLFRPGIKPIVKIAAVLTEAHNENRLRSTLAHEFGHVLLHDPIFQQRSQNSLFDSGTQYMQVCYRDGIDKASVGDLFEFQAWFICGSLLMPQSELNSRVIALATSESSFSEIWQHSQLGLKMIEEMSSGFAVSRSLARIRLLKTGLLTEAEPCPALF
jgi:hypothetical protein